MINIMGLFNLPYIRSTHACRAMVLLTLLGFTDASSLQAQPDRVDPLDPQHAELIEYARMIGTITVSKAQGWSEAFAMSITSAGDVDTDSLADWFVGHLRCDSVITTWTGFTTFAEEILLYRGVRGSVPPAGSGERIGPTEFASRTRVLALGDFDNDRNRDLVARIELMNDTTSGNQEEYSTSDLVIFWGNPSGDFTLADTSRLVGSGARWLAIKGVGGRDVSGDGIDDLVIAPSGGFSHGAVVRQPRLMIFTGGDHRRWGRDGVSNNAAWQWWNTPTFNRLGVTDQNCDGHSDAVLYFDEVSVTPGHISILYGNRTGLPDTTDFESIDLTVANGHYSLFSDVTGDRTPDLVMTCGLDEQIKIYAGRPGQRLRQQYGGGNDAPVVGQGWWRRPWIDLWLPFKLHDGWSRVPEYLYDLGDITGDGTSEIWAFSKPFLIAYRTGAQTDSLIDAKLTIPYPTITAAARLGDIDGSGTETIAIGYDQIPHDWARPFPGGIMLLKRPAYMEPSGIFRPLPHLAGESCGGTSRVSVGRAEERTMRLFVEGSSASGRFTLRWSGMEIVGSATLVISDSRGEELLRATVNAANGYHVIPNPALPAGPLFVRLVSAGQTASVSVLW